jgi:hypothetical protein
MCPWYPRDDDDNDAAEFDEGSTVPPTSNDEK